MGLPQNNKSNWKLLSVLAIIGKDLKKIPLLPMIVDEQLKVYTFLFHPVRFRKMQLLNDMLIHQLNLTTTYHRYGGIEFRLGKKEIAHMHSNGLLDIYFPKTISTKLIENKICEEHHVYPDSGWTSSYIKGKSDIAVYFRLIEFSYQLKTGMKTVAEILTETDLLINRT